MRLAKNGLSNLCCKSLSFRSGSSLFHPKGLCKDWSLEREEMIYDPICMKLVQHLAPIWPYLVWYKSEISAIFGFGLPIFGAPAVIISLLLAIPSCCSEVSPQLIRTIRLTENSIPISSTQSKLNLICILLLTMMMTYKKKLDDGG